ncbi:MAG: TetR family transcriptional regulator [Kibdelosporangium sp.]
MSSSGGLRARKKARTRAAILRAAFRLFREHGYATTTVEQIAEAAEVSPATFFRYFPAKEDLVALDHFPPLLAALAAQPPGDNPVEALRGAFRAAFDRLSADEIAAGLDREVFAATVPELITVNIRRSPGLLREISAILAGRTGLAPESDQIRDSVGAALGIVTMIWLRWAQDPGLDAPAEIDRALAHLAACLTWGQGTG